jgi:superfamily II DNA/RNA helicase
VVLDEADRMLDIGFLPDLQRILSYLPKQRQTLLFSATFSPEIRRLAESYLQNPLMVEVARPNATATNVEQHFYSVSTDDKRRAVLKLLKERSITQALVFVNSKLGCARLARSFERDGPAHQRPARRQVAGRAAEGARGVQGRHGRRARRHRRRGARPRHRRPAGGVQFRRPVQRRGLRPPHRPHRPGRRLRAWRSPWCRATTPGWSTTSRS